MEEMERDLKKKVFRKKIKVKNIVKNFLSKIPAVKLYK